MSTNPDDRGTSRLNALGVGAEGASISDLSFGGSYVDFATVRFLS
jgi:hypothetical protein